MPRSDLEVPGSLPASRLLLAYGGIFIVALVLRLVGISAQNIWYDEHWTLQVASAPITELPDLLPAAESSKPPLYFALMNYWMKFGAGEFWLRLPSAIFGALDCVGAAVLGRQLFTSGAGACLGWLLVISPFHIYYSQEGRPYALWSLLITLALFFLLKFQAAPRLRFLISYAIFALLACYTFTYSVSILAFSILLAMAYRPALSRKYRSQLVAANGLILVLYLPWLWKVLGAALAGVGFQPLRRNPMATAAYSLFSLGFGMSGGPCSEKLRGLGMAVFREDPLGGAALIFGFLLLGALVGYGLILLWKSNRNAFHFSIFGLLFFWGTAVFLDLINPEIALNPRYVFPALIPMMVIVLAVCTRAFARVGWGTVLPVVFLLMVSSSLARHYFDPRYARDDLRSAARFVDELEPPAEQVVICAAHLVDIFNYYFSKGIPVEGITILPGASMEDSLRTLHQRLAQRQRFVLVYSRPDHGDPERALPAAMQSRYRLSQRRHWTGVDVYVFEAPEPTF